MQPHQFNKTDAITLAKQKRLLLPHVAIADNKPTGYSLITSLLDVSEYTPESSVTLLERYQSRSSTTTNTKGLYVGFYLNKDNEVITTPYVKEENGKLAIVPGNAAIIGKEIEVHDIPMANLCLGGLSMTNKKLFWQALSEAAPTAAECKTTQTEVAQAILQEAQAVTTQNIFAFDALVTAARFDKELYNKIAALENAQNIEILRATGDPRILALLENSDAFCDNLGQMEGIASLLSTRGSKGLLATLAQLQELGFGSKKLQEA